MSVLNRDVGSDRFIRIIWWGSNTGSCTSLVIWLLVLESWAWKFVTCHLIRSCPGAGLKRRLNPRWLADCRWATGGSRIVFSWILWRVRVLELRSIKASSLQLNIEWLQPPFKLPFNQGYTEDIRLIFEFESLLKDGLWCYSLITRF